MKLKLPKPLRGWRAFAGEVGTILIGVLLALAAQEFVQDLHWKREVRETRKALDAELARNAASFEYRMSQSKCVQDRVDELRRWADGFVETMPMKLKGPISGPPGFAVRTAVWEVTDGEIASRIPLDAKLSYAGFYDAFRVFSQLRQTEEDTWNMLVEYQDGSELEAADVRRIKRMLSDIEGIDEAFGAFRPNIRRFSMELNVRPDTNIPAATDPAIVRWNKDLCTPLL